MSRSRCYLLRLCLPPSWRRSARRGGRRGQGACVHFGAAVGNKDGTQEKHLGSAHSLHFIIAPSPVRQCLHAQSLYAAKPLRMTLHTVLGAGPVRLSFRPAFSSLPRRSSLSEIPWPSLTHKGVLVEPGCLVPL